MKNLQNKLTTVRIPQELYQVIQEEARSEGVGFNTILNRILKRHVEWDRVFRSTDQLSLPRELATEILDLVDEEELEKLSRIQIPKQIMEMSEFLESEPEKWLTILDLLCRYGGLGSLQIKENGSKLSLHLRHGLGEAASRVLHGVIESLSNQSGYIPKLEMSENSLSVSLENTRREPKSNERLKDVLSEIKEHGLKFKPSGRLKGRSGVYHRLGGTLEDSQGRLILIDFPEKDMVTERDVMGLFVKMIDLENIGGIMVGKASEGNVKKLARMYNILLKPETSELTPSLLALFAKNEQR